MAIAGGRGPVGEPDAATDAGRAAARRRRVAALCDQGCTVEEIAAWLDLPAATVLHEAQAAAQAADAASEAARRGRLGADLEADGRVLRDEWLQSGDLKVYDRLLETQAALRRLYGWDTPPAKPGPPGSDELDALLIALDGEALDGDGAL